ncbi:MAG: zf-HC2 domain-containing protein [Candidatus Zixiibacteriota bacterium]
MNCRKVHRYLFGYFRQELSAEETQKIKTHLDVCPECAREATEVSEICLLVRDGMETLAPSADFDDKLLARIRTASVEAELGGQRKWWLRFLHEVFPSVRLRWALVGAVSVMLLALVVTFTQRRQSAGPESFSLETLKDKNPTLVSSPNVYDTSDQGLTQMPTESPPNPKRAFVIDNFSSSWSAGEDGRIGPGDAGKRFVIERGLNPAPRKDSHYVLPVMLTQPQSEKTDY